VRPRAALLVYGFAFAAMLAAGAVFALSAVGTSGSNRLLWVSSGLSALAIMGALLAALVGRR
jgi:hypothetical protein